MESPENFDYCHLNPTERKILSHFLGWGRRFKFQILNISFMTLRTVRMTILKRCKKMDPVPISSRFLLDYSHESLASN